MSVLVCLELNVSELMPLPPSPSPPPLLPEDRARIFFCFTTRVLFSSLLFDASRHDICCMLAWTINNVYLCWQCWFLIRNFFFPHLRSLVHCPRHAEFCLAFLCAQSNTRYTHGFKTKIYLIYLRWQVRYVYCERSDGGRGNPIDTGGGQHTVTVYAVRCSQP